MARTNTSVDVFKEQIRDGVKARVLDDGRSGFFTCGSHMGSVAANKEHSKDTLVYIPEEFRVKREVAVWWTEKIAELGVEATYLGTENDQQVIEYKLPDVDTSKHGLVKFALLRYLWATPYTNLVNVMYEIDTESTEDYNFWNLFMKYHARLSEHPNYSKSYGLTSDDRYKEVSNLEEMKTMVDHLNEHDLSRFSSLSINTTFDSGAIWSSSYESQNMFKELDTKKLNKIMKT